MSSSSTEEKKPEALSGEEEEHDDIEATATASSSCRRTVSLPVVPVQKIDDPMGITKETNHVPPRKRQNLLLEIPSRTPEEGSQDFVAIKMPMTPSPTPTPKRVNFLMTSRSVDAPTNNSPMPPTPSSRGKSTRRSLLPKLSFRYRTPTDIEKATTSAPEGSSSGHREKPSISRSLSLSKIFTPRIKRMSSLPVEEIGHSNTESAHGGSVGGPLNKREAQPQTKMARSLSVPVNNKEKSIRRMDSFFRIIPSTPRVKEGNEVIASSAQDTENDGADGEDIAEEEAVCRICLVDLCEGGETFKLECSCKGELALAHQECAIKWFSIKGNKTCDVCKEEVRNLPVTLLKIQSVRNRNNGVSRLHEDVNGYRVWQEVPVLVIVSMLAYFCFLEQLLVGKMGTGAIAISLPFSCVLGLLSSMTSSTMVKSRFIWIYASFQFALVVLFAHIFYSLVRVQAVLSILLATFAGFGVVMSGSSILVEVFRWRRRLQALSEQQHGPQLITPPLQNARPVNMPHSGPADDTTQTVVQDQQQNSSNS
ncbi:hypothetical protein RIF29_31892 [Crotalaria pallida]|uniref:RING-CH-type domain-containing protein n=1 Tax=Crotalaria pallida TaxID=3830 RepID=A0AAN9EIG0_CROPI